mmetsp:Transcript_13773/g.19694  ORF Transcript_13773/g.19694 Transcript_13773/m.19694 type:complete len:267 (-) Transcript_13773:561-1361(-)
MFSTDLSDHKAENLLHRNSSILCPISGISAYIQKFCLWSARFGLRIVFPSCCLGKTHENTFNTATCLKSEYCSTVVNKVEFHISTSTHELPFFLFLSKRIIFMIFDDGSVSINHAVQTFLTELKNGVGISVILVIEENSPKPTCFVTMFDNEVSIGPCLKFFIIIRVVFVTYLLVSSVKMFHIFLIDVGWGDVSSTTEPPHATISLKISVVEVHGRSKWILWVHNTGKTTSKEWNAFTWRHASCSVDTSLSCGLKCFLRHCSVHNT